MKKKTIAIIDATFAVAKRKPEKNCKVASITAVVFFTFKMFIATLFATSAVRNVPKNRAFSLVQSTNYSVLN